jgi:hypothetical protein
MCIEERVNSECEIFALDSAFHVHISQKEGAITNKLMFRGDNMTLARLPRTENGYHKHS